VLRRLLLGLAALVAAWLVACLVLFVWPPGEAGAPTHADVVVVLSGDRKRLAPGLALIRRGVAPVLAISSVGRTRNWRTAEQLCAAGRYRGARVLCFDAVPYSTQGEARAVRDLARPLGWHSVVVVTSTFHVTRAKMLFRRCLHIPVHVVGTSTTWWRMPVDWTSETGKLFVQLTVQRGC
jgi:uncharacterized SAM-binding protein YcdF (DUF218 family)